MANNKLERQIAKAFDFHHDPDVMVIEGTFSTKEIARFVRRKMREAYARGWADWGPQSLYSVKSSFKEYMKEIYGATKTKRK